MSEIPHVIRELAHKAVAELRRSVDVRAAYLYGSQVDGTADEWSDIDVGVFVADFGKLTFWDKVQLCVDINRNISNDLDIHFFSTKSLHNPDPASFAKYIIDHGVRLE